MKAKNQPDKKEDLILIVDDVPKNIQLLGKILDHNGYKVVAVTNGDQVMKAATKYNPDLILLDIMMPGKTGFEVCEELKAKPKVSDIPVIFLTARTEEEDVIRGLSLGGVDYITKPFNSGELLARIDAHMSLKKARDLIIEQQEELHELSKTKDKLYSIIAHDLKGALFGITGLTELLQNELDQHDLEDGIKGSVDLIYKSAHSASQILENLLIWTRLQTNLLELDATQFSLSECIEKCIQLYQTQANNKNVQIKFTPQNTTVYADEQMMSTVFRNLISNAIKFSSSGDSIYVEIIRIGQGYKITVKDEGMGMPKEVIDDIFNPKDRPQREGTSSEKGTGLGLLLCKEFVEMHEGEIMVESEPGSGTEFSVTFPKKEETTQ